MAIAFGLQTKTQVFICSETTEGESIIRAKDNANHTERLNGILINILGDQADAFRLRSYAVENTKLIALQHRIQPNPALVASVISNRVHGSLRRQHIKCQSIIGGISSEDNFENITFELYAVDGYGACYKDNFVVSGYGLYFLFGVYDLLFKEDMNEEQSMNLIRACLKTLNEKLALDTSKWRLDIIDCNGPRSLLL